MNPRGTLRWSGLALFVLFAPGASYGAAPSGHYATAAMTVLDTKTGLTWQRNAPTATYAWADAKDYCAGVGSSLGGSGWHLPNIKELQTIVDDKTYNPAIDTNAFPNTPGDSGYWSSNPVAGSTTQVWYISWYYGEVGSADSSYSRNVRCVR